MVTKREQADTVKEVIIRTILNSGKFLKGLAYVKRNIKKESDTFERFLHTWRYGGKVLENKRETI